MKKTIIIISAILLAFAVSFVLVEEVSAQQLGCCLKTDDGDFCSNKVTKDQCEDGLFFTGQTCDAVTQCNLVTCIPSEGACQANKPLFQCQDERGRYDSRDIEEVEACQSGGCNIGNVICEVLQRNVCEQKGAESGFSEEDVRFTQGLNEIEVRSQCSAGGRGTCELGGGSCSFTTIDDCSQRGGNFIRDVLPSQVNSCGVSNPEDKIACGVLPGDENKVFYFNEQGSQEALIEDCNYPQAFCIEEVVEGEQKAVCKSTACEFELVEEDSEGRKGNQVLLSGTSMCYNFHEDIEGRSTGLQHQILHCVNGEIEVEGLGPDRNLRCLDDYNVKKSNPSAGLELGANARAIDNLWENCRECGASGGGLFSKLGAAGITGFIQGDIAAALPDGTFPKQAQFNEIAAGVSFISGKENRVGDVFQLIPFSIPPGPWINNILIGSACGDSNTLKSVKFINDIAKDFGYCKYEKDLIPWGGFGSSIPKVTPGNTQLCGTCGGGGDDLWNVCDANECNALGDCQVVKAFEFDTAFRLFATASIAKSAFEVQKCFLDPVSGITNLGDITACWRKFGQEQSKFYDQTIGSLLDRFGAPHKTQDLLGEYEEIIKQGDVTPEKLAIIAAQDGFNEEQIKKIGAAKGINSALKLYQEAYGTKGVTESTTHAPGLDAIRRASELQIDKGETNPNTQGGGNDKPDIPEVIDTVTRTITPNPPKGTDEILTPEDIEAGKFDSVRSSPNAPPGFNKYSVTEEGNNYYIAHLKEDKTEVLTYVYSKKEGNGYAEDGELELSDNFAVMFTNAELSIDEKTFIIFYKSQSNPSLYDTAQLSVSGVKQEVVTLSKALTINEIPSNWRLVDSSNQDSGGLSSIQKEFAGAVIRNLFTGVETVSAQEDHSEVEVKTQDVFKNWYSISKGVVLGTGVLQGKGPEAGYICRAETSLRGKGTELCGTCESEDGLRICTKERCEILGLCQAIEKEDGSGYNCVEAACELEEGQRQVLVESIEVEFLKGGDIIKTSSGTNNVNAGELPWDTTQVSLKVETNVGANCRFSTNPNTAWEEAIEFDGATQYPSTHETILSAGGAERDHTIFIKCQNICGVETPGSNDNYYIKYSKGDVPDFLPPVVTNIDPSNVFVPEEPPIVTTEVRISENGQCYYSEDLDISQNIDLSEMEQMQCAQNQKCFLTDSNTCALCQFDTDVSQGELINFEEFANIATPEMQALVEAARENGIENTKVSRKVFFCEDTDGNRGEINGHILATVKNYNTTIISPEENEVIFEKEVYLDVETSHNAECKYSINTEKMFSDMEEISGSSVMEHQILITNLTVGSKEIFVTCEDFARQQRKGSVSFEIKDDDVGPLLIRAFKDTTGTGAEVLKIVTDEISSCRYSLTDPGFSFDSGIEMPFDESIEHIAEYSLENYYVKCKDRFDNQREYLIKPTQ